MPAPNSPARVVLVPTPIGNLADVSQRALATLREARLIAAEDTRQTRKLLAHYDIHTPLLALHQHNEHARVRPLLEEHAAKGGLLAVVSDAGTPGISDPGFLLARTAVELDLPLACLPGPTAFVPALVMSGLPCDRFVYEGFLPQKKGRQTAIKRLASHTYTTVLYEAPHRVLKLLAALIEACGPERPAALVREISKLHEEAYRGTLQEIHDAFSTREGGVKGECVLVLGAAPTAD